MSKIILRAVGDNLLHKQVYKAARKEDGSYCFDGAFEHVGPLIKEADISVINQETVYVNDRKKISSFPSFGSPVEAGDAIRKAGFDLVTHASNHALDKGYQAIKETVAYWENADKECEWTGIHTSREDAERIRILERKGIRVAFLNYTAPLNYHPIPPTHPYCVDVMKGYSKKRIERQIGMARQKADIVAVFPHWGCEYLYEPIPAQVKWAHFFADAGADLIIGTHPHVLQYKDDIISGDGRKVPCLYSLGNFISCQVIQGTMLGGMADIVISDEGGKATVEKADIIPLVTHTNSDYSFFTTYPLSEYNDELAAESKIFAMMKKNHGWDIDMKYLNKLYEDIMNRHAMENSIYKSPKDISAYNRRAVLRILMGKSNKG
ncbi:MAG: CapA family protein [Lachnospiraceae bacterium]|nr:CapA family protein [Lachnospiraceae bacterium]